MESDVSEELVASIFRVKVSKCEESFGFVLAGCKEPTNSSLQIF
jgi:hypothetical protein